jgi:hypothetical protein
MENVNLNFNTNLQKLEENIYTQIKKRISLSKTELVYSDLEYYLEVLINLNIDNLIDNLKIEINYDKWRK